MGFKYRKSIKISKGVKVNVSKSGINTSVKVANVTHNSKRGTTVNLGNGLSYHVGNSKSSKSKTSSTNSNINIGSSKFENSWDKMTDKQIKIYNIVLKSLLWLLTIMCTILAIAIPPVILVAIGSGIFAYKFDARKKQIKVSNVEILEVEDIDIVDTSTLNNAELLNIEKEIQETREPSYEVLEGIYNLNRYT